MNATKPFQTQNFYELLEVAPSADDEEIKAAYERSLELYGPDSVAMYALDDNTQVSELRARIDEAWKVLGDQALRGAYDASLGYADRSSKKSVALVETTPAEPPQVEAGPAEAEDLEAPEERVQRPERVQKAVETPPVTPAPAAAVMQPPSPESKFVELEPPGESAPSPALQEAGEKAIVRQPESPAAKHDDAKSRSGRVDIPPEADFNGELLRRVREGRGKSLQQIAEKTRIGVRHLENVEADRYGELPAPVYLRGILMNLARELKLDPLRVSKSYLDLVARGKK